MRDESSPLLLIPHSSSLIPADDPYRAAAPGSPGSVLGVDPPMVKRGPPPPRPPLSSLASLSLSLSLGASGSPAGAASSRSASGRLHWAFLRDRPILRSPRSTRRIFTSISSP